MLAIIAPSLDDKRIFPVQQLNAGQVHRSRVLLRHASGKGANAARVVSALNGDVLLCALAGHRMRALLEEQFAFSRVRLELTDTAQETRSCTTVLEESGRATELVQEALPVENEELHLFREHAERACAAADVVLLAGSLPPGFHEDFYAHCTREAHLHDAVVIIDAQRIVLQMALSEHPDVIKINREELRNTVEKDSRATSLVDSVEYLRERGARHIVITDGPNAVTLFELGKEQVRFQPPCIRAVNPVGSGDAMSGALAFALQRGMSLREAVPYGIAAGAANARTLLPGDIDSVEFEKILRAVS